MNLADPYLKTTRAKEHLESLRRELEGFYESKPYRFVREDDTEKQRHIVRMKHPDIPDKLSLIAGDVFYNLRASLDQLVWCLAKSTAAPSYPLDTEFPILEKRNLRVLRKRLRGVPAKAAAIIESLQPYNGRDADVIRSHLLWRLNKLCNIDKHMRIPVHGMTGLVTLPPRILALGGFHNGTVMDIPLSMKSEMALDPPVTFKVVFGDFFWKVECDYDGVEKIYEFVSNRVIPRFSQFCK